MIDLHCDTLLKAFETQERDLWETKFQLSWKGLLDQGARGQFMAIYLPTAPEMEAFGLDDWSYVQALLDIYQENLDKYNHFLAHANSFADYQAIRDSGRLATFLTIEDGRLVQGDFSRLQDLYDRGIRLITLTWNAVNCFGHPNSPDPQSNALGLSPFGKEAVQWMNQQGMIVDVSHLSDGGFWDVAQIATKPFLASHSNARALTNHPRNLTQDMLRTLGEKGGLAGLNFSPSFLQADDQKTDPPIGLVSRMSAHLAYLLQYGGEDCIALGTDFDGISGIHQIQTVSQMPLLLDQLSKDGFSPRLLDKFLYQNAERFLKDVL